MGWLGVVWYTFLGGKVSEEEEEGEVRRRLEEREKKGGKYKNNSLKKITLYLAEYYVKV